MEKKVYKGNRTKFLHMRLTEAEHKKVRAGARKANLSITDLVLHLLTKYLPSLKPVEELRQPKIDTDAAVPSVHRKIRAWDSPLNPLGD